MQEQKLFCHRPPHPPPCNAESSAECATFLKMRQRATIAMRSGALSSSSASIDQCDIIKEMRLGVKKGVLAVDEKMSTPPP